MLKSEQAACQFAHGWLLMARLPATRSRRTTSRKDNCVRDLREGWVSFTVLTDDRSPRIGCPVFQLLTDPPRLFPPHAGLFRLAGASQVAFEGFFLPCSGFGGSSVSSVETSFLLSSCCLPSARVLIWSGKFPAKRGSSSPVRLLISGCTSSSRERPRVPSPSDWRGCYIGCDS
jgi:hypothetical protein